MAKINITHTDRYNIPNSLSGTTNMFYDLDGVLKQKDTLGVISIIGTTGFTGITAFVNLTDVHLVSPQTNDLFYWSGGSVVNSPHVMSGGTNLLNIFTLQSSNVVEKGLGSCSMQSVGMSSYACGADSIALGYRNTAYGANSFASGTLSIASGASSHSEGNTTYAIGDYSHSEGNSNYAKGQQSHVEGTNNCAIGDSSHVQGSTNISHSINSFVGGYNNILNNTGINSAIIAGTNITGHSCNTLYTQNLEITGNSGSDNQLTMVDKVSGCRYAINLSGGTFVYHVI